MPMEASENPHNCDEIMAEFKNHSSHKCQKNGECIRFLQLYIDNMACKNKDHEFLEGINDCSICCEYFQTHDCIKRNLKSKTKSLELSDDFVNKLRHQLLKENYYTKK